ncbi:MAG TPA: polyphosphate kinase 1 [Pyrinomonadaceae bacterium]|nr:polyphosphate kinase 1 [Pyrinomonadaceae bacterium]
MLNNLSQIYPPGRIENFPPAEAAEKTATIYINRDLSLIEFFRRVLDEALDTSLPMLERLKFIAILSSNLDEFFMIRVSGLKDNIEDERVWPDGYNTVDLLKEIRARVLDLTKLQEDCLCQEIIPALKENGIVLTSYAELDERERHSVNEFFLHNILPVLTPQAVDPSHPFPYISGSNLNIGMRVKPHLTSRVAAALKNYGDDLFVRVKIPSFVDRFVRIDDDEDRFILVEDLVSANIQELIPEAIPEDCHLFRIARDADIELRESEAADLLAMMEDNLRKREFGDAVRLEVSRSMPDAMIEYLTESISVEPDDIYKVNGPMGLSDFWFLYGLDRPDLKEAPIRESVPACLQTGESIFDIVKRRDVLLHHPFNSYSIITDLIKQAAEDDDVLAIKICLYRTGLDSPIPPALIEASERGKQVTAVIEIKARFDEANNIEWAKQLERAGVHVVYGLLGLKTHAKTTLIVRREGDELRRYVHLATGNYNPQTSAVYTDLGLLTVNEEIAEDATELFNFLTVYSQRTDYKQLLVAPINLRERMIELIDRETENAKGGKPARIIAKINRLADTGIVQALYEASNAGVKIDLIIRGICTLRPGVPGMSENITVRSIVGRLLEHSRVYYFENAGANELFMGSSDWMPRNLDRRVEVLTPIIDPDIKRYLKDEFLPTYLRDTAKSAHLMPDGKYERRRPLAGEEAFDAQLSFQGTSNIIKFDEHH